MQLRRSTSFALVLAFAGCRTPYTVTPEQVVAIRRAVGDVVHEGEAEAIRRAAQRLHPDREMVSIEIGSAEFFKKSDVFITANLEPDRTAYDPTPLLPESVQTPEDLEEFAVRRCIEILRAVVETGIQYEAEEFHVIITHGASLPYPAMPHSYESGTLYCIAIPARTILAADWPQCSDEEISRQWRIRENNARKWRVAQVSGNDW